MLWSLEFWLWQAFGAYICSLYFSFQRHDYHLVIVQTGALRSAARKRVFVLASNQPWELLPRWKQISVRCLPCALDLLDSEGRSHFLPFLWGCLVFSLTGFNIDPPFCCAPRKQRNWRCEEHRLNLTYFHMRNQCGFHNSLLCTTCEDAEVLLIYWSCSSHAVLASAQYVKWCEATQLTLCKTCFAQTSWHLFVRSVYLECACPQASKSRWKQQTQATIEVGWRRSGEDGFFLKFFQFSGDQRHRFGGDTFHSHRKFVCGNSIPAQPSNFEGADVNESVRWDSNIHRLRPESHSRSIAQFRSLNGQESSQPWGKLESSVASRARMFATTNRSWQDTSSVSSISLLFWGQVEAMAMKLKPSSYALAKQARFSFSSMHVRSKVDLLPCAGPYSIVEHYRPAHCIYDFEIISGGVHDSCWSTEGGT